MEECENRIKMVKDKVKILDDGRVEIIFLQPLPLFRYRKWVKFYTRESELLVVGDKITGIRCHSKVWEEILKSEAPNRRELLEKFRKIVEEGSKKTARLFGQKGSG